MTQVERPMDNGRRTAQQARTAERMRSWADFLDRSFKYWALIPAGVLLIALTVHPVINLVLMSLHEITFTAGKAVWTFAAGRNLDQFAHAWLFRKAVWNTLIFVVAAVSSEMVIGFFLALLVSPITTGKGIVRTIMVLPILVPPVAIGSMWKLMYNYDFGVLNQILIAVGLAPQSWIGATETALMSVIIVDIWHWVPFVFLILLAGLEALPQEVFEAARVDGAGRWQTLRLVTIPMMWPAISVALVFRTIFAFKVFDEVFLLTTGGPGTATEVVSLNIYKTFFTQNQLGFGALLAIVTIAIIAAFVLTYWRLAISRESRL